MLDGNRVKNSEVEERTRNGSCSDTTACGH